MQSMASCTRNFADFSDWTKIVLLGSLGNAVVGGLTGFIGSLILQRDPMTTIAMWWIGCLSGVIGGLLHTMVVYAIESRSESNSTLDWETNSRTFGYDCALVFSQAPCWSALGATISYLVLVGSPFDSANQVVERLPLVIVLLTALAGTLGIAIYATAMSWMTGSEDHLLILQNTVILMAEDMIRLSQEPEAIQPMILSEVKIGA